MLPITCNELHIINYEDFRKCGEVLVLPKQNLYALCCRFCPGSIFANVTFLLIHMQKEHGKQLGLLQKEVKRAEDETVEIVDDLKVEESFAEGKSAVNDQPITPMKRCVILAENVAVDLSFKSRRLSVPPGETKQSHVIEFTIKTTNKERYYETDIPSQQTNQSDQPRRTTRSSTKKLYERTNANTKTDFLQDNEKSMLACLVAKHANDNVNGEVPEESGNPSKNPMLPRLKRIVSDDEDVTRLVGAVGKKLQAKQTRSKLKPRRRVVNEHDICEYCKKSFPSSYKLYRHVKVCHIMERAHKCCKCGASFLWQSDLKRHMKTHKKMRPFQCTNCNYASKTAYNLKAHMRTHTGERPFECSHCNKTFVKKRSLNRHLLLHLQ